MHLPTYAVRRAAVVLAITLITAAVGYGQNVGDPSVVPGTVTSNRQTESLPAEKYDRPLVKGVVFVDTDGNGKYGNNDMLFAGVKVSNGKEITKTDDRGRYELPLEDDSMIFVIKPAGYRTALSDENLPKFFYIHKPDGSPKLQYTGSKPTGEIPRSVDFPLYQQREPENFQVILFGDPQPRNIREVDYVTHDVVSELIGNKSASFGVSLGDLAFDNLETLRPLNQSIAMIGIPWYNVIGNHDLNLDSGSRKHVNETFEDIYGPTFYSFDYGRVHFVVLDNIDWSTPANDRARYFANFGKRQLDWLKTDLTMIPESQMVVLFMHVPITDTEDSSGLFRLIENRPLCMSISAHRHIHRHLFLGQEEGWNGKQPHHHVINVTVSGSWWSGQKDERGIPHTTMADGAPNGYSILTFDQNGYKMDFKAAQRTASEQMRITMDYSVNSSQSAETDVWVNVYNGSEKSTVRMSVDGTNQWTELVQKQVPDPTFVEIYQREQSVSPIPHPELTKPAISYHLWNGKLPADLPAGIHQLLVETTDMHGRNFSAKRAFRVTGEQSMAVKDQESKTTSGGR